MQILVVSDLPHFVTGGAEMQAARLVEAWLDAGHQVVCLGRRMGTGPVSLGRHTVAVRRIHTTSLLGRWGRAASYFMSLAWLLLRYRRWADVVYTRFLGEAAATAALLKAAGLLRTPLIATPANTRGDGDTNLLRTLPCARWLIRLLDHKCDAINLIASEMSEELREAGFSGSNFSHIPNGIQVRELPAGVPRSMPRLLAVGRLSRQKGYDVLLHALARVREHIGEGQVAIVGDGPERGRLLTLTAELNLSDKVVWLGELSQQQIAGQLEQSNVFLLPSRYEGMSNAGLEAMERGLPLILTRCGGLDRYIGPEMGWVVPSEDERALSDALAEAVTMEVGALSGMGQRARQCIVQNFDMNIVAHRYIRLFETLVSGRGLDGAAVHV